MNWKPLSLVLILAGSALPAGDPQGFYFWPASSLKGFAKSLAPKINDQKIATQQLGAMGNYSFLIAHREGSGQAEWHGKQADIMVVESGQATLVYGGSLVDGKTTAPDEMRGTSINGGMEKKLGPGDVITIPIQTPHQLKVDRGKETTYLTVKVTQ